MASRIANVTDQILEAHRLYGGSDNTNAAGLSSSRSLNYATGGSIQRPDQDQVTTIPRTINYRDSVGLFGTENHFVKVNVRIQNPILGDFIIIGDYQQAHIGTETVNPEDPYTLPNSGYSEPGQAFIDYNADEETDGSCGQTTTCINTYQPAMLSGSDIGNIPAHFFKVELINLKTGNKYNDDWLDIRLYNKYYEEHPYDIMYIKYNEPFYIGFHARNTRRLAYNVDCVLGKSDTSPFPALVTIDEIDPRLLATKR